MPYYPGTTVRLYGTFTQWNETSQQYEAVIPSNPKVNVWDRDRDEKLVNEAVPVQMASPTNKFYYDWEIPVASENGIYWYEFSGTLGAGGDPIKDGASIEVRNDI